MIHWRTLRERLEGAIRNVEDTARRHRLDAKMDPTTHAADRRHERLLRLRRVRAKIASRERLANGDPDQALRVAPIAQIQSA